ncbi:MULTISPECIES: S-layer homology domain-containing protein [unclassified Fusibacter]|uniref:S-layer homology domain-containing protein n=1 Tax=unclassified Fusibacter TaxID=2624464 RepID=UPI001012D97B|nr:MULTISPECIES: S-layer homology domain-containing protein [unclassified Fusibacter]MCK8060417.1 S-layer homology domain-containing protein [Fusibacter sp. A2]NPE20294.1 S-layer homology domain-containing protein [Fusibacter sp. A1]RXV63500.1 S-layer homology domain-containing protein [Fusibacter sp. A1]
MKKIIALILMVLLVSSSLTFALTDIDSHWSKLYVDDLITRGAINGYPDGSFKPDNKISVAAFTKILVSSMGYTAIGNSPTGHWAQLYMDKAKELGLITRSETEFTKLDSDITRGQIARMISRAMTETFDDLDSFKSQITDYNTIAFKDQAPVLLMYRSGIITGYTDGSFKDTQLASRGEASTMLVRFLDEGVRKVPEIVVAYQSDIQIEEFDDPNKVAFSVIIDIFRPLNDQYVDLKSYLLTKVDQKTTYEIIEYVKTKTNHHDSLPLKSFEWGNSKIQVGSNISNSWITIRGL